MLVQNVAHGNLPGDTGRARAIAYRRVEPIMPPMAMMATTPGRTRRLPPDSAGSIGSRSGSIGITAASLSSGAERARATAAGGWACLNLGDGCSDSCREPHREHVEGRGDGRVEAP